MLVLVFTSVLPKPIIVLISTPDRTGQDSNPKKSTRDEWVYIEWVPGFYSTQLAVPEEHHLQWVLPPLSIAKGTSGG